VKSRAAFVLALTLVVTVVPSASAAPPSVITLVSETTSESSVDAPPRKDSAGDRQLFTSRLLNARRQFGKPKGAAVGSDRGTLTLTSARSANLKTVAKLPGGTITTNGPLRAAGDGAVAVAVVAGTGTFAGARGMLTILKPTGQKTAVNIYRLSYRPTA
jgi:Dirigent-like protein